MRRPPRVAQGLLVAALACGGCGRGGDAGGDGRGYGPAERRDFVDACAATGVASTDACGCFYDRLAEQVPHERFDELDDQIRDDPSAVPDDIAALAIECGAEPEGTNPPTG
jgi:hypothetical protein